MNFRQKQEVRHATFNKYHTPACGPSHTRPVNACFFSAANSIEHELMKARVCHELLCNKHEFVTEAVRNGSDPERRVDIVDLTTGEEIEIETTPERAARFIKEPDVLVIPVGWSKKDEKWISLVKSQNSQK